MGMRFWNSTPAPVREFSLKELVSAINELQKRRQAREDATEERDGGADSRRSSNERQGGYDFGQELTE